MGNQYSPYYDQYSAGYKPSAYAPPKTQTFKSESPKQQISYKPSTVVSNKPLPSIPHPVYSFPQPIYKQPKVTNNRPSYSQPQVFHSRPSYNSIQHVQPSYQPSTIIYSYKPSQTDKEVTDVVDSKAEEEEVTEAAPEKEVKEESRSGNILIEKGGENSDSSKTTVDSPETSDKEGEEAREARILVIDDETLDFNSNDPFAVTTLLPEFVPNIFEEAKLFTPGTRLEITTTLPLTTSPPTTVFPTSSESSIRRRPVISVFNDLTTSTTTLRPTTSSTTTTTKAPIVTATSSLNASPSSSIRRRPVISLFHDLNPSTSLPDSSAPATPLGDIGQTILDKIRTVTLTVESILESDEEINSKPDVENIDTGLESEINNASDEENLRDRRKIMKVRKPKSQSFDQEHSFAPNWQTGGWF